jgi:hypothetical protein
MKGSLGCSCRDRGGDAKVRTGRAEGERYEGPRPRGSEDGVRAIKEVEEDRWLPACKPREFIEMNGLLSDEGGHEDGTVSALEGLGWDTGALGLGPFNRISHEERLKP